MQAIKNGADGLLAWRTASESNTDKFEIEQSKDGITFSGIGQLAAAGNSSSIKDYTFTDKDIEKYGPKIILYRLKQFDKNGGFVYSRIAALNMDVNTKNLSAYPVPFHDRLFVDLPLASKGNVVIALLDMKGITVYSSRQEIISGQTSITLEGLSGLVAGNYLLTLTSDNGVQTQRVTKQ